MAHTPPKGSHITTVDPDQTPFENDGFVGVAPEYQNFANETDKPHEGSEDEVDEGSEPQARSAGVQANTDSTPSGTEAGSPAGEAPVDDKASTSSTKTKIAAPAL